MTDMALEGAAQKRRNLLQGWSFKACARSCKIQWKCDKWRHRFELRIAYRCLPSMYFTSSTCICKESPRLLDFKKNSLRRFGRTCGRIVQRAGGDRSRGTPCAGLFWLPRRHNSKFEPAGIVSWPQVHWLPSLRVSNLHRGEGFTMQLRWKDKDPHSWDSMWHVF